MAELPDYDHLTAGHALAAWKGWLAGHGFGVVPIAEPRSFQWAGWWIAVVDGIDGPAADGPQQQVAVLAFGTPPGVVLSPQAPALLGRATAKIHCASDEDSDQDLVDIQVEAAIVTSLKGRRREFGDWLCQWGIDYALRVREDHSLFVDAFREGRMGIAAT